jgi:hypothetical protein
VAAPFEQCSEQNCVGIRTRIAASIAYPRQRASEVAALDVGKFGDSVDFLHSKDVTASGNFIDPVDFFGDGEQCQRCTAVENVALAPIEVSRIV